MMSLVLNNRAQVYTNKCSFEQLLFFFLFQLLSQTTGIEM